MNRKAFYLISILILTQTIQLTQAWHKGYFTINSTVFTTFTKSVQRWENPYLCFHFSKECGTVKRYSPESPFELWGTWPWLGLLYYDGIGAFRCNAVLIHPEAALTSLDCLRHDPQGTLSDHLYIAFSMPGQLSFQNISVTHLDFAGDRYNTGRDITLMKLSKPIITSPQVHPICLWETHLHYSQQIAGHIGMIVGSDLNNMYKISELRVYQAPVKVLSEEKCKNIDLTFYKQVVEPGICFIYLRDPKECHAVGSILMFPRLGDDGEILWYLRGIFSQRGYYCNSYPMLPTFDIGVHRLWIESHFVDKYVQPKVLEENKTSIEHIETIFSKKYEEKHNVIL